MKQIQVLLDKVSTPSACSTAEKKVQKEKGQGARDNVSSWNVSPLAFVMVEESLGNHMVHQELLKDSRGHGGVQTRRKTFSAPIRLSEESVALSQNQEPLHWTTNP
ncbi:uncharacterized protein WM277_000792 [Molossus nigricans]